MENWEETIREELADERIPLPEGDWEWFESNKLQPFLRRRRLFLWSSGIAGLAATASLALIFLLPSQRPLPENHQSIVSESVPSASIVILETVKDSAEVCHVEKRASHTLVAHDDGKPNLEIEFDDDQSSEESVPYPDRTEKEDTKEYSYGDHYEEDDYSERAKRSHFSVAPLLRGLGGKAAFSGISQGISSSASSSTVINQIPISVGMELSVSLIPSLSLTSGADVTLYRSRYGVENNTIIQNAYYLGIPLRLDWTAWEKGPVSAWMGAGGKVDRLVYGKFGQATIHDNTFNWSLTGSAGVQYELFPNVGLFLSPEVSYYFKLSNPVIQTYRTENPLMITIGAGLRINL